jgi:hypothetical protein
MDVPAATDTAPSTGNPPNRWLTLRIPREHARPLYQFDPVATVGWIWLSYLATVFTLYVLPFGSYTSRLPSDINTALFWGVLVAFSLIAICLGWLHPRIRSLRAARSNARRRGSRLVCRLKIARMFGRRGRRSLVRSIHRRGLPPLICIGIKPDPAAFDAVQLTEQQNIFSGARNYGTARPSLTRGTGVLIALGLLFSSSYFITGTVNTWVFFTALLVCLVVWRAFRNSQGQYGPGRFQRHCLLHNVLVDLDGVYDNALFRSEQIFRPSQSVLFFELQAHPREWRLMDPRTAKVIVRLIDSKGRESTFKLIGVDNPSIADLGARWLHGWGLPRAPQPTQLGTLPQ